MVGLLMVDSCTLIAQLDTVHWFPPLHSRDLQSAGSQYLYLSTPSTDNVTVVVKDGNGVELPASPLVISNGFPVNILVGNGQATNGPLLVMNNQLNNVLTGKGITVEASAPVFAVVRYGSESGNQGECVTGKGTRALGNHFRFGAMPIISDFDGYSRSFVGGVMATQNGTVIEISDYDAGVVFAGSPSVTDNQLTITLNAGETYVFSGYMNVNANWTGMIGALVESNQPIVFVEGNWLGGMNTVNGQDIAIDQLVPTEFVGRDYVLVEGGGLPSMERGLVVAWQDGTEVWLNDNATPSAVLDAGDWFLVENGNYVGVQHRHVYIHTSKSAYVFQFLGGTQSYATPGMNFVPPLRCNLPHEVDEIPDVNMIGNFAIAGGLLMATQAGAQLEINGVLESGGEVVSGFEGWEVYKVLGLTGDVTIESTGPLAVSIFGFNGAMGVAGYYSGFGTDIEPEFQIPDEVCFGEQVNVAFTEEEFEDWTVIWDFDGIPNEPDGANGFLLEPSSAGTYDVQLSLDNGNGCILEETKELHVHSLPQVEWSFDAGLCSGTTGMFTSTNSISSGEELTTSWTVAGPVESQSQGDSFEFSAATVGAYSLSMEAISSSGCASMLEAPFEVYPSPDATFMVPDVCTGESVSWSPLSPANWIGDASWSWQGQSLVVSASTLPDAVSMAPGMQTVEVLLTSDFPSTGVVCASEAEVTFEVFPLAGSTTELSACDSIFWNGDVFNSSGVYEWLGSSNQGCDSVAELVLNLNNSEFLVVDSTSCDPIFWNGQLLNLSGTYGYSTSTTEGCDSLVEMHFVKLQQLEPDLDSEGLYCHDEEIVIVDGGDYSGLENVDRDWLLDGQLVGSDPDATLELSGLQSGGHTVGLSVQADNACPQTVMVELQVLPELVLAVESMAMCIPLVWNPIVLVNGGSDITDQGVLVSEGWFLDGAIIPAGEAIGLDSPGTHELQVERSYSFSDNIGNQKFCGVQAAGTVEGYPIPAASWESDPQVWAEESPIGTFLAVYPDEAVSWTWTIDGEEIVGGPSLEWMFEPSLDEPFHAVCLTAFTEWGCSNSDCGVVELSAEVKVYVPNAFTPDNDGINDAWAPVFSSPGRVQEYTLLIFDEWGEVVFQSEDLNKVWQGTLSNARQSGEHLPQSEVFTWMLTYASDDRLVQNLKGSVTLIR